ncbi:hypothetical protein PLEOSDRAFT_1070212 [Pleurotus ostreatus PC15]|uniref:Uncharacterized protein n=1 Tax=Pleurotus ostreatus (strain PC15) TaxID=1137138 RepID=A0A067NRT1_PLEO1|nr:hypothetical protein PLEOSDRAFT_1070212 [Pleurotus ostreatus PC15]
MAEELGRSATAPSSESPQNRSAKESLARLRRPGSSSKSVERISDDSGPQTDRLEHPTLPWEAECLAIDDGGMPR